MACHRMGPPTELVLGLKEAGGLHTFVETGTYRGDTAAWAAGHFAEVVTIELSTAFHNAAVKRFAHSPNVMAVHGDSAAALEKILTHRQPSLFWLDAHWSGGQTAGQAAECPLLAEVAAINRSALDHVILVDDARLFSAPPPLPHQAGHWPSLSEAVYALENKGCRHVVLWDDVFVAVPRSLRRFLTDWLQSRPSLSPAPSIPLWRKLLSR